jgi:molybdopterin molybdotransferase
MSLMPVADARGTILADADPLLEELVPLGSAHRRVLARDLAATRTQPPLPMAAMDGYAIRAADAALPGARLTVIGEVAAGRPAERALAAGEAMRIFTGGVVPVGADAVVIQEDTTRDGDLVLLADAVRHGHHIRAAGIDFHEGDVLLRAGTRLSDRDLALAASMNHAELPVRRRPKIAMLATGDELVMPGSKPGPGQILYANGFALHALARDEGADTVDLGIAADSIESTTAAIRRARELGVDILVTTGGASAGDHDMVLRSLQAEGVTMSFWKIAMRPGKPMMHGRLGTLRVIGLPGNPVSSYVCAFLFLVPLIRALSGRRDVDHVGEGAVLGRSVGGNDGREDYLRASLDYDSMGRLVATPVERQDSSLLSQLASAQALVIRTPFAPAADAGSPCRIIKLPL